ncbi:MAG: hypothetical protein V8T36_00885 [Ruthenibacterium lactatiformans]
MLVEQAVPGFEVGCAVLGAGQALTVGGWMRLNSPMAFLITRKNTRWRPRASICPPACLWLKRGRVREAANTVYRALGCRGFARVDLFYTPDGRIVFNEVNTIPGSPSTAAFPA